VTRVYEPGGWLELFSSDQPDGILPASAAALEAAALELIVVAGATTIFRRVVRRREYGVLPHVTEHGGHETSTLTGGGA